MNLKDWMQRVHNNAKDKGWYSPDLPERTALEQHMLMVAELAEATESVRKGEHPMWIDPATGKPEGELVELADVVIRIFDYCQSKDMDLEHAIRTKHQFNTTRPVRHGGKLK